ncbi:MAG: hypothetical protein NUV53_00200 [Patescibacteria group bacterium]|nr:hypothetical protein [Patescibacteria group bacterium]
MKKECIHTERDRTMAWDAALFIIGVVGIAPIVVVTKSFLGAIIWMMALWVFRSWALRKEKTTWKWLTRGYKGK